MQGLRDDIAVSRETNTRVLDVIREKTRGLHDRVEASFDLTQMLSSRVAYRSLLQAYLGIYRPFELEGQQRFPHLVNPHKTSLIVRDLEVLGMTDQEIRQIPECSSLPDLMEPDRLFGALYVINGSSLGGQIICRQVESCLGIDKHTGASFFHGDGERTGSVWRAFLYDLQQLVLSADQAAEGACEMFALFETWLPKMAKKEGASPQ